MRTLARFSRPFRASIWGLVAGSAPWVGSVLAVEARDVLVYSTGPLRLKPQLDTSVAWDSNVLYRQQSVISDVVTAVSPGLKLELGGMGTELAAGLDYTARQQYYAEHAALDHLDHSLSIQGRLQKSRLGLKIRGQLDSYTGVITGNSTLSQQGGLNNLGVQADRVSMSDEVRAEYAVSDKTAAYASVGHSFLDYASGTPLYDYTTVRGTLGGAYKATTKTAFFLEGSYGSTTTSPNFQAAKPPELRALGTTLGIKGDFTPKLTGSIGVGYEFREFADRTTVPDEPTARMELIYKAGEKLDFALQYTRGSGVATDSSSASLISDSVTFRADQRIGIRGKLKASAGATARWDSYTYPKALGLLRDDSIWLLNFNLTYQMQLWFSTSLGYEYERYSSSLAGVVQYDANRVILRFSVGY